MTAALRRSALLLLAVSLSAATACASIDAPGTAGVVGTGEPTSVETGIGETENPSAEPDATENPADNGVLKSGIYEGESITGRWVTSSETELLYSDSCCQGFLSKNKIFYNLGVDFLLNIGYTYC